MQKLTWILSLIGAFFGIYLILTGFFVTESAPQEAAAWAGACAVVIVPYVIARAIQELSIIKKEAFRGEESEVRESRTPDQIRFEEQNKAKL